MEPLSQPLPKSFEHAPIPVDLQLEFRVARSYSSQVCLLPVPLNFVLLKLAFYDAFKISNVIKAGTGHLWNVLTKIQTTVKKDSQTPCGICWINLIVQNRKREKVNKILPLRFRANEKKLFVLLRLSFSLHWAIQADTSAPLKSSEAFLVTQ